MELLRDTYVEINLDVIKDNVSLIKNELGKDIAFAAVVKANAYGHGLLQVSEALMEADCDLLAVATLSEALAIKEKHPDFPVFIMGHTPNNLLKHVVNKGIIPTIFSYEQAKIINELSHTNTKVHIKVDTGFHRLGLAPNEIGLNEALKISALKNIEIDGIFSHLALTSEAENDIQFKEFTDFVQRLELHEVLIKYKHIADSIATIDYPKYRLNMVRVGALIYGMRGFHIGFIPVRQALTWKAKISQLHEIKKGEGVGYDYIWKAARDSVIATLPFGYADGYPRNLAGIGFVTINGKRANLVGILCMDQCMIDVTDFPGIKQGDVVIIYGSGYNEMSISEASMLAKTNKNDIITRIGQRPQRIYISGGK